MATIRQALDAARAALAASPSASLDAQVLLAYALGVERSHLFAHPEDTLTPDQAAAYDSLVAQCAAGLPVAYATGRRAFYDRDFLVTPDVLIPRPETEHLLEAAMAACDATTPIIAADIGTGSGILAVTFAAHRPLAAMHAVDASAAALDVARQNAARHAVPVGFHQGDLAAPLAAAGVRVDLLMANLPYIPTGDLAALAVARSEPLLALDGGPDGLDLVRRLLDQAPAVCRPGALLLLEIGAGQGEAAAAIARARWPGASIRVTPDYAGHDRLLHIRL
jgi:release factor glutamine methyltransferase